MNQYEVLMYDSETREYHHLGWATGKSTDEAKKIFVKENKWKPKKVSEKIFVKIPICR